ncbi:MAG: isochorismatase family protein [Legionellales bacterium]|nr:isochorismatase family protein [Legionellales bacterium]
MTELPPQSFVASFDVDAQYAFTPKCPQELPIVDAESIVPELNRQAQFAQLRIGSKDAHHPQAVWVSDDNHPPLSKITDFKNVDHYWPPHAIVGTKGFSLIEGLPHPSDYDFFIWKGVELDMHPYGACYHDLHEQLSTGVIEYLLANKMNTVIVGGLATDYCVKATALQLAKHFRVIVNLAACRGVEARTIQQAKFDMLNAGIILCESTHELWQPTTTHSETGSLL